MDCSMEEAFTKCTLLSIKTWDGYQVAMRLLLKGKTTNIGKYSSDQKYLNTMLYKDK